MSRGKKKGPSQTISLFPSGSARTYSRQILESDAKLRLIRDCESLRQGAREGGYDGR